MTLFTASETLPFGAAMLIMIGIGVIEAVGMMTAFSPSEVFDRAFGLDEVELGGVLGWLHVGKVPMLVLLTLSLLGFGLAGYAIQIAVNSVTGHYIPAVFAAIPAFASGIATVRGAGSLIAKIIPRDESTAVSEQTLIGRTGTVVTGTARRGLAAEVKVRDQHGNPHYLMLEPDIEGEELEQGAEVLIVKKQGAVFRGIRNPHPILM